MIRKKTDRRSFVKTSITAGVASKMKDPNGGALFIGEKGEIRVDRGTLDLSNEEWREIPLDNMKIQLRTSNNHYRNWIDCMRDRSRPVADVEIGHRSATACHLGNIARWISQRTQQTGYSVRCIKND